MRANLESQVIPNRIPSLKFKIAEKTKKVFYETRHSLSLDISHLADSNDIPFNGFYLLLQLG